MCRSPSTAPRKRHSPICESTPRRARSWYACATKMSRLNCSCWIMDAGLRILKREVDSAWWACASALNCLGDRWYTARPSKEDFAYRYEHLFLPRRERKEDLPHAQKEKESQGIS